MSTIGQTLFRQVYFSVVSTLSAYDTYILKKKYITINSNYFNFISNNSDNVKYDEIENVHVSNQSWLGYFFGYGRVKLLTSSGTYNLKFVKNHQALADAINERR